jgi:hypothetical protein
LETQSSFHKRLAKENATNITMKGKLLFVIPCAFPRASST